MQAAKAVSTSSGTDKITHFFKQMVPAVIAQSSEMFTPTKLETHSKFDIIRIESVNEPTLTSRYFLRKAAMKFRMVGIAPDPVPAEAKQKGTIGPYQVPIIDRSVNECMLFLGHTNDMIKRMCTTGARPDLGHYDEGAKGHGALGRGAYFSDRIDKSITYSPCPGCGRTGPCDNRWHANNADPASGRVSRSVLLSRVLLGYSSRVDERGRFRHANFNELVRHANYTGLRGKREEWKGDDDAFEAREKSIDKLGDDPNQDRDQGVKTSLRGVTVKSGEAVRGSGWDSLYGAGSYTPGGSAVTAIAKRGSFDSDEYLVRNADQILPAYIIHYQVLP